MKVRFHYSLSEKLYFANRHLQRGISFQQESAQHDPVLPILGDDNHDGEISHTLHPSTKVYPY